MMTYTRFNTNKKIACPLKTSTWDGLVAKIPWRYNYIEINLYYKIKNLAKYQNLSIIHIIGNSDRIFVSFLTQLFGGFISLNQIPSYIVQSRGVHKSKQKNVISVPGTRIIGKGHTKETM